MMEQTAAFGNEASAESSSLDGHPEHRLADREEPAQFRVRRARLDALPELEPLAPAGRDRPEQECRLARTASVPCRSDMAPETRSLGSRRGHRAGEVS